MSVSILLLSLSLSHNSSIKLTLLKLHKHIVFWEFFPLKSDFSSQSPKVDSSKGMWAYTSCIKCRVHDNELLASEKLFIVPSWRPRSRVNKLLHVSGQEHPSELLYCSDPVQIRVQIQDQGKSHCWALPSERWEKERTVNPRGRYITMHDLHSNIEEFTSPKHAVLKIKSSIFQSLVVL